VSDLPTVPIPPTRDDDDTGARGGDGRRLTRAIGPSSGRHPGTSCTGSMLCAQIQCADWPACSRNTAISRPHGNGTVFELRLPVPPRRRVYRGAGRRRDGGACHCRRRVRNEHTSQTSLSCGACQCRADCVDGGSSLTRGGSGDFREGELYVRLRADAAEVGPSPLAQTHRNSASVPRPRLNGVAAFLGFLDPSHWTQSRRAFCLRQGSSASFRSVQRLSQLLVVVKNLGLRGFLRAGWPSTAPWMRSWRTWLTTITSPYGSRTWQALWFTQVAGNKIGRFRMNAGDHRVASCRIRAPAVPRAAVEQPQPAFSRLRRGQGHLAH
jgi:hypothetical protein